MRRSQLGKSGFKGGYTVVDEAVNNIFNLLVVIPVLVASLPVMGIVALLIFLHDGLPIFYVGTRLGRGKRPFNMYKFRTLVPDAETRIGAQVLAFEHRRLVTPLGNFLRATRLDELPQLFNVLHREMDIFGPRPQRPAVYESICSHIKGYDRRFMVNPGLIGYPQLFLPHNAPKRIQSRVDNRFLWKKKNILWEIFIIGYTIVFVGRRIAIRTAGFLWHDLLLGRVLHRFREKRELERVAPQLAHVDVIGTCAGSEAGERIASAVLVDINERAFLMHVPAAIAGEVLRYDLNITVQRGGDATRRKQARCSGKIYSSRPLAAGGHAYVVEYTPVSSYHFYLIHQYFLMGSMVS